LSAHSFRVGLTKDLFEAGEDGSGIALRYARELAVGRNVAARVLGKMRGARWRSPGVVIHCGSERALQFRRWR
jgi:hypothetical protein